jgi:N-acetyl sugar amidotransferase
MDSTIKVIEFDDDGICNYCKTYKHRLNTEIYEGEERTKMLNSLIENIKDDGKDKQYDCLIGVSGGVDSSYVAHLVKKLGLRPLAIHLDNGWNSELAVKNIQQLLEKLDIDLYTHVINWEEFRDLQRSFILSSVENIEIASDHAINAILLKTADKYGIKYILNGSNLVTEGILARQGGKDIDYRLLKDIHNKFGTKKLKTYPSISIWNFAYKVLVKKIKFIPFLNYFDFNKEDAIILLEKEYGWKRYGGKHYESIFTRFFQGYILPNKFNYDKRKSHFSSMIISNHITRDDAIAELKQNPYPDQNLLEEDLEYFLKKLGFTKEEFEKIMKAEPKEPTEYKSYEKMFEILQPLVHIIKEYAKGTKGKW